MAEANEPKLLQNKSSATVNQFIIQKSILLFKLLVSLSAQFYLNINQAF